MNHQNDDYSMKVFVGSINFDVEEDEIKKEFEQFGEILDTVILRDRETNKSRGFGFITFKDKSSVDRAIKEMNHKPIRGRPIVVNFAEKKTPGSTGGGTKPQSNSFGGSGAGQEQGYGGYPQQQQQGYYGQQPGYGGWNQQAAYSQWNQQPGYGQWNQQAVYGQWNQQAQAGWGQQQQSSGAQQQQQNSNGYQQSQQYNGSNSYGSGGY